MISKAVDASRRPYTIKRCLRPIMHNYMYISKEILHISVGENHVKPAFTYNSACPLSSYSKHAFYVYTNNLAIKEIVHKMFENQVKRWAEMAVVHRKKFYRRTGLQEQFQSFQCLQRVYNSYLKIDRLPL
jgi:hypothetical protein